MPTNKYANPKEFLNKIMQVESSGGKDTMGQPITSGIQAGTSAIGRYQLMPNTVKEIINRRRMDGTLTQPIADLDSMNPKDMKAYIEANPDIEEDLANGLAKRVLQRQLGDEDKAAYSWTMGHNLSPEQISNNKLNDTSTKGGQYVDKFRRIKQQLDSQQQMPDTDEDTGDNSDNGDL